MDCGPFAGDLIMNSAQILDYEVISQQLDQLITISAEEIKSWDTIDPNLTGRIESNLDALDYCFSIAIGLSAPFITTSEELEAYLKEIHNAASEATGDYDFLQRWLGSLLHHKGDPIDQVDGKFIKRDRNNAYVMFHRLLWGHDIISIKQDNPFYQMIKKQGLSGVVQALQHLLADTTSKQGLPFPGSSYFDYYDDDGRLWNYLIDAANNLSVDVTGTRRAAQDIYSHMFTVRAADLLGGGSVLALSDVYYRCRSITDKIRRQQFGLIAYSISFWGQAIVGAGKLGVPYVNIPLGTAMIRSFSSLLSASSKETRELLKKGRVSAQETARQVAIAEQNFSEQKIYEDKCGYLEEQRHIRDNSMALMREWTKGACEDEF